MFTLPPGLNASHPTGTLQLSIQIHYLNLQSIPKQHLQLCLQVWGISELVPMHSQQSICTCSFLTRTNKKKLTSYLSDMGVIVVHVIDRRVNKKVGVGYFKIRKYIINGLVSEFTDEEIQFLQISNKRIIGAGKMSLQISENKDEPQIEQQRKVIVEDNLLRKKQANDRRVHDMERKQEIDRFPPQITQNIFHSKNDIINLKELEGHKIQEHKKKSQKDNKIVIKQEELSKMKTIDELQSMYGRNNPYLEKMKIKLDEINLLDHNLSFHPEPYTQETNYAIYISCIKPVPPASTNIITAINQLSITNLVQLPNGEEVPNIQISINNLGTLPHNLIYLGRIQLHSILQFESKLYKGRYQVRQNMLTGSPKTIFLKKKQNNKKTVQIQMSLRTVNGMEEKEEKKVVQQKNKGRADPVKVLNQYYVDIQDLTKHKINSSLLIKAPNKQPVKGNKLIFSSQSNTQVIRISNDATKCEIQASEGTVLKEEKVKLGSQIYLVRIGVSSDLRQLMEVMESSKEKKTEIEGNTKYKKENDQINQEKSIKPIKQPVNRMKKLKYLIRCLQQLSLSHNSECQTILNKMMENYQEISENQEQTANHLFQQLCIQARVPEPSSTVKYCFQELLHGQFTMFWECFLQFHQWNIRYLKSQQKIRKSFLSLIKNSSIANNSQKQMSMRFYRNDQQVQKILKKMIKKLNRRPQILFGLLDKSIAIEAILKFLAENVGQGSKEIDQNMKIVVDEFLQLIADRYGPKIKISELENLLIHWKKPNNCEEITLILNQMQLVKIYENYKNKELLEEVIRSCGLEIKKEDDKEQDLSLKQESKIKGKKSRNLLQILVEIHESETSMLETSSEDGFDQQDEGIFRDYRKYITEQNDEGELNEAHIGNRRKEAIDRSKRNLNNLIQKKEGLKVSQDEGDNFKKATHQIQESKQQTLTLIIRSFAISHQTPYSYSINITNSENSRQPEKRYELTQKQLPIAVQLYSDCEYKIDITAKNLQQQQIMNCYGLFISSQTLKNIVLYKRQRDAEQGIIGSVQVGIRALMDRKYEQQLECQHDDEIILEVRQDKKRSLLENMNHKESENNEIEEQKILKQQIGGRMLNELCKIRYQIVQVYPPVKVGETIQIIIEGVNKMIEYPFSNIVGVIHTQKFDQIQEGKSKQQISIDVIGKGRQKLRLTEGLHEICILAADQSVQSVIQIQLLEYLNEQIMEGDKEQKQEEVFGKSILLNIYHLESLQPLFNHLGNQCTQPTLKHQILGDQLQILISTSSKSEPIHSKHIHLPTHQTDKQIEDFSCIQGKISDHHHKNYNSQNESLSLRSIQLNFSIQLSAADQKYIITVYKKLQKIKTKSNRELLACFEFGFKKHKNTEIGVFQNKGYLIDEHGFRLAINVLEINYNDIFSKDEVGRIKFEKLLSVFEAPKLRKISKELKQRQSQISLNEVEEVVLKKVIQNSYGFSETQIYTLFQLQRHKLEFISLFKNWDTDCLISSTNQNQEQKSIDLKNYSLKNLFEEYKLFDFKDDGLLPYSKAQIINKILVPQRPIPLQNLLTSTKSNWVIDHHSKESLEYIDYMLILWNLKKYTSFDDFFTIPISSNVTGMKHKGVGDQNNQTIMNILNQQSKYNGKRITKKHVLVKLLEYRNLKVNEKAPTLTFYINGQKMAEPKLRSISCKYIDCPQIVTTFPITLQIKNRVYGYSASLYEEETVAQIISLKSERVQILEGQVMFEICDAKQKPEKSKMKNQKRQQPEALKKKGEQRNKQIKRQQHEQQQISMLQSRRTGKSHFRQSRRDKWQNLQQSKQKVNKIRQLLTKTN